MLRLWTSPHPWSYFHLFSSLRQAFGKDESKRLSTSVSVETNRRLGVDAFKRQKIKKNKRPPAGCNSWWTLVIRCRFAPNWEHFWQSEPLFNKPPTPISINLTETEWAGFMSEIIFLSHFSITAATAGLPRWTNHCLCCCHLYTVTEIQTHALNYNVPTTRKSNYTYSCTQPLLYVNQI